MKLFFFNLTLCLLLLTSASPIHAANWYVDNQATGFNTGTSWTDAWKSFTQIGWNSIKPGDTLFISGGSTSRTYPETLTVGASGSTDAPITIDVGANSPAPANHEGSVVISPTNGYAITIGSGSAPRSYVTVNGSAHENNLLQTTNTTGAAVYIRSSHHIILSDVNITTTNGRGVFIDGYGTRSSNITVKNCHIKTDIANSGTQTDLIYGQLVDDLTIEGNTLIHGDTGTYHSDNIQVANNWKRLTIRNNWIEKMSGTGTATDQQIIIQHEQANDTFEWAKIYNNVVIGGEVKRWGTIIASPNSYGGLYYFWNNTIVGKYSDPTLDGIVIQITGNLGEFTNNIVTGYDSVLVQGNSTGNFTSTTVTHNCLYNTTSRALTSPTVTNSGGVNDQNCGYDPASFQLNPESPSINQGVTISDFTTDKAGIIRIEPWDIGAYEYVSSSPTDPFDFDTDGDVDFVDFSYLVNHYTHIFDFNSLIRQL